MGMPENGLFVVRQEGGEFEWLDKGSWDKVCRQYPIYGVKVGALFIGRDSIIKRYNGRGLWARLSWQVVPI